MKIHKNSLCALIKFADEQYTNALRLSYVGMGGNFH